jgi:hypothetical protein
MVRTNAQLLAAPAGTRFVWLFLVDLIRTQGSEEAEIRCAFDFGSPFGLPNLAAQSAAPTGARITSFRELSLPMAIPEKELIQHMAYLVDRDLIRLTASGIALPTAYTGASSRRADAARRNGALGGRPRKDGVRTDSDAVRASTEPPVIPAAAGGLDPNVSSGKALEL